MKFYKNLLVLIALTHFTACTPSMPIAGNGKDTDSINKKRGKEISKMIEAQRQQYERQQNIELREDRIQAEKERFAKQCRNDPHECMKIRKNAFLRLFGRGDITTYKEAIEKTPLVETQKKEVSPSSQPKDTPEIEDYNTPIE